MAQNKSYIAVSATFTPTGGSACDITDLEHVGYQEAGQEVDMTTDASETVNGMYLDSIKGDLTIETSDASLLEATTQLAIGTQGAMVIVYGLRKGGIGQVSGAPRTLTIATCQIRGVGVDAGATGASRVSLRFGAYDPSGASIRTWT